MERKRENVFDSSKNMKYPLKWILLDNSGVSTNKCPSHLTFFKIAMIQIKINFDMYAFFVTTYSLVVGKVPDTVRECYDIFRNLFCCINKSSFTQHIHPFILS